jgi:hypothetical protein
MCNPLAKVEKMKETKRKVTIRRAMRRRIHDLNQLYTAYMHGYDETGDFGTLGEYGLSLDYVAPGTFDQQREGYFRYLLSWGGPSDEFRFFVNLDLSCHRVEYWYLDWFEGALVTPSEGEQSFLIEIWQLLTEFGAVASAMQIAHH